MKTLKRFVAMLLTVTMVLSFGTFVSADEASLILSDINTETLVGKSVTELVKLGIINGYEDGTFRPDKTISRGEFAKIITTFLNVAQLASDNLASGFPDVDGVNHWARKYIKLSADMGIVNGYTDGTFRPDDPVKYVEAVKMIVAALRYTKLAERYQTATGPWYQGYMAVAAEKGILNGAAVNQQEDPASRGTVAILVYNSLDVAPAEDVIGGDGIVLPDDESSALEDNLGKKSVTGIITDAYQTGIASSTNSLNKNEVIIKTSDGSYTCRVPKGTDTMALLGYRVSAYMENLGGGEYELSQITRERVNKTHKISSAYIENSNSSSIEFWESDTAQRSTRLNFEDDLRIIYNGKYVNTSDYGPENFKTIKSGDVTLLSNDSDDDIEIAFVTSYETVVVSSKVIGTDDVKLYGMYGIGEVVIPKKSSSYIYSVTFNGAEYDPANIVKWDVVSIQRSHPTSGGKKVLNVIVTRKKVSGNIKEIISESEINISDKIYKVSQSLVKSTHGDKPKFDVSEYVTVYLDHNGEIAAAEVAVESVSVYLAYLVNAEEASGIDSGASVLVYGITGKTAKQTYQLADKVKVDGVIETDNNEVLKKLKDSAKVANATKIAADPSLGITLTDYAQLIRFSLNSAGKIDTIDTVKANETVTEADLVQSISYPSSSYPEIKYSGSGKFASGTRTIFNANSSTKVVVIPDNVSNLESYSIKTYSATFSTGVAYNIEVYNRNDVDVAKYILVYGGKSSDTEFNENSPFVITKNITGIEGSDKLNGLSLKDGSTIPELYSQDEGTFIGTLTTGDIFRYTRNTAGEAIKIEKVLDIVEGVPQFIVKGVNVLTPMSTSNDALKKRQFMIDDTPRGTSESKNRFYYGTVVGREGNQISLTNTLYTDTCGITEDEKETFTVSSSTKIYTYDLKATKTENMILSGASIDSVRTVRDLQKAEITDMSGASQVMVYVSGGVVQTLIIFK